LDRCGCSCIAPSRATTMAAAASVDTPASALGQAACRHTMLWLWFVVGGFQIIAWKCVAMAWQTSSAKLARLAQIGGSQILRMAATMTRTTSFLVRPTLAIICCVVRRSGACWYAACCWLFALWCNLAHFVVPAAYSAISNGSRSVMPLVTSGVSLALNAFPQVTQHTRSALVAAAACARSTMVLSMDVLGRVCSRLLSVACAEVHARLSFRRLVVATRHAAAFLAMTLPSKTISLAMDLLSIPARAAGLDEYVQFARHSFSIQSKWRQVVAVIASRQWPQ